jgi:hypothetical protein
VDETREWRSVINEEDIPRAKWKMLDEQRRRQQGK